MSNKRMKTNVEVVTNLMEHSRAGALIQPFVIQAIRVYSEMCIEKGAAHFDSGLMSGQAWIVCAEDAKKTIEEHYS